MQRRLINEHSHAPHNAEENLSPRDSPKGADDTSTLGKTKSLKIAASEDRIAAKLRHNAILSRSGSTNGADAESV